MTSPTYPLATTLNRIWACNPCEEGKQRALAAASKNAPDDEPVTYAQIAEAVSFEDALWCCRAEPQYSQLWRLFAVWCARQVQHLLTDVRSVAALDVAERYANGQATEEELTAAHTEAYYAVSAASASAFASAAAASAAASAYASTSAAYASTSPSARAAQRAAFIQLVLTGTLPPKA